MKNSLASNLFFATTISVLAFAVIANPPGGVRWGLLVADEASLLRKVNFLASTYVWPAILSFCAISMFQLQSRLSSSGANARTVFSVCVVASGAMLLGLRTISVGVSSTPSYVTGMALGYTIMSQLYAVRMRKVFNCVRIPWPIWRGDRSAVEEINSRMQARAMQARAVQAKTAGVAARAA